MPVDPTIEELKRRLDALCVQYLKVPTKEIQKEIIELARRMEKLKQNEKKSEMSIGERYHGQALVQHWQCFHDLVFSWDRQNARGGEKRLGLNLVAVDHYHPTLGPVYLAIDYHAVFQDGKFCGPIVWASVQETVVMLGSHFDQDLHEDDITPNLRDCSAVLDNMKLIIGVFESIV